MTEAAVQTYDHRWYQGLTPLARHTVDAWFASNGLSSTNVRTLRVADDGPGCIAVIVKRDADGSIIPNEARNGPATEERSFRDRPAVMR